MNHLLTQHLRRAVVALPLALFTAATAHAEAAAAPTGGGFAELIPLILIFVIFYFLLIRPQQKRMKEHKQMLDDLKKGDRIVTGGGVYGTITDLKEREVRVEIADGIKIRVRRDTIAALANDAEKTEE